MTTRPLTFPYGVIADDFTGATDVAGLLARGGARVALHTVLPDPTALRADPRIEAHVIALKIRTIRADEAVRQAVDALRVLQASGARRFYWKYCSTFDSTSRGNIGPVAEALLAALGAPFTLYCPGFPENGRVVTDGHLFVNGVPLNESPMKDHPLTPMRDSNLTCLLLPQVRGLATRLTGPGDLRARAEALAHEGVAHLIPDTPHQNAILALGRDFGDLPLLTGASPLAAAAFGRSAATGSGRAPLPPGVRQGPAILLSGSCSQATRAQVAAFAATGALVLQVDPIALAEKGAEALVSQVRSALGAAPLLVSATTDPDTLRAVQTRLGVDASSRLVEETLARVARTARDAGATRVIVAGGETAGAVTQALGATSLEMRDEIAPGVPWCIGSDAQGPFALALKSGNFGGPTFFNDALERL